MIHLKTWQPLNTNRKNAAGFLLMLPEQTALLLQAGLCLLSCSFPSANIELTHVLPTAARTVWRQPNFVTLPNCPPSFSFFWKELEKCPSAPRPSSFQLKGKVLFWYFWCSHHISPYSILFLLVSSPVLENTLHSNARAKYPLLFTPPSGNSSLAALRDTSR